MKKTYIIAIIGILIFIILVIIGINIYNKSSENLKTKQDEQSNIYKNSIEENMIDSNIEIVTTSSNEEKTSPNCIFTFKTYYKKCGHIKIEKNQIDEIMVNKTREDLKTIYKEWNIVTFRNDEVVLYKEEDESCGEHYVLKILDGYVAIYTIDENEKLMLKETTSILTKYLPKEDIEKLEKGIRVNGKEELNQAIEDYE